jgi:hypothetical protein
MESSVASIPETLPKLSNTTLNIKMDRDRLDAISGQFVRVGCHLVTSKLLICNYLLLDDPSVEILWYNRRRQIKESARTPIRNYTNESILEIFDCSVAEDSGQVICLAIGETGVVSDICMLSIKGKSERALSSQTFNSHQQSLY